MGVHYLAFESTSRVESLLKLDLRLTTHML